MDTHPVRGKVQLVDGDIALLKGSNVEIAQEANPEVRASGVLADDGSFELKTFHQDGFVAGAREGAYKARIVLADESDEGIPKRPNNLVHRRFFDFETSGLSLSVPSSDYTLQLSGK